MSRLVAVTIACIFWSVGFCSDLSQQLDRIAESRRQGRTSEALQMLRELRRSAPQLYLLNNVDYLEAVLLAEDGKKAEANALLVLMLESGFPLPDRLLLHLIENASEDQFERQAPHYEAFLANYENHSQWYPVAFDYAALLSKAKRDAEALKWYEKLAGMSGAQKRLARLRVAETLLRTAGIGVGAGTPSLPAQAKQARVTRARDLLKELLRANAEDSTAGEAALILHQIDHTRPLPEKDLAAMALALIEAKRPILARTYLQRVIRGYPRSREQGHYHYLRARCTELESASRAVPLYAEVYGRFPSNRWGVYSLYRVGSIHLRGRRYSEAAAAFRKIASDHPGSPYFGAAVIDLSEALVYQGDRAGAELVLEESLSAKAGQADRARFHYHLARVRLEQQKWPEALDSLTAIRHLTTEQLPSGVTEEEVAYWRGVCLERSGTEAGALEEYRRAANGQRIYFAYLSAARASDAPQPLVAEATRVFNNALVLARPLFEDEAQRKQYRKSSEILRIEELLFLRLFDEAYREMRLLKPEAVGLSREDYLFHLAHWAVQGGLNWESMSTAEQLHRLVSRRETRHQFSAQLIDLLYPRHYWEMIESFARRYSVDPILILAMIRQESGFFSKARSSASARGLLQIMPATGRELARRAGLRLNSVDRLYEPAVSIQLGCMYLKEMIGRYDGRTEKALAAYNGGPGNVDRWSRKVSGEDPVVFVSNIGFRETKHYVLRVIGNYHVYRTLMDETKSLSTKEGHDQQKKQR